MNRKQSYSFFNANSSIIVRAYADQIYYLSFEVSQSDNQSSKLW